MIVTDIESVGDRVRIVVRPGDDIRLEGKVDFPAREFAEVIAATVDAHGSSLGELIEELVKREQAR